MSKDRIVTILQSVSDDGALAEELREQLRCAAAELNDLQGYSNAVETTTTIFTDRVAQRTDFSAELLEVTTFGFRAGLEYGLAVGILGEPEWQL